eukprot:7175832-Pyramimonas_sp.AAC.2
MVALYAYAKGGCRWIQLPAVVYGAHTSTTLAPILLELWSVPTIPTDQNRLALTGIYLPYLLIPMFIGCVEFRNVYNALQRNTTIDRKKA